MKNDKIITVSVAAYNLGKLIEKNIKSFIKCKKKDKIEVLIINDGSTDNTKEIVEKYEKEYPDIIKLINKKNAGAGSTVNVGIENASGKYFRMVDGDDWIDSSNFDILIEKLEDTDVDMVLNNYEIFDAEKNKCIEECRVMGINKKNQIIDFKNINKSFSLVMHQVIFKTEILKNNKIKLDNGFYTDIEYLLYPLPYVKNFIYYDFSVYIYMVAREGQSMSFSSLQKHIEDHQLVLNNLIEFYKVSNKKFDANKKNLVIKKISNIATNQLQTLLTFNDYNYVKKNIEDMNEKLKSECYEIYKFYKRNSKKAFLLIASNNLLLRYIMKNYQRKNKRKG